ncbi:MAG: hypothetical protein ACREVE_09120 [Gammaproteobacteria bacterium]
MAAPLKSGETVRACVEPDLDQGLRYAAGLVMLIDRRIAEVQAPQRSWRQWSLDTVTVLRVIGQATGGAIELLGPAAAWPAGLAPPAGIYWNSTYRS